MSRPIWAPCASAPRRPSFRPTTKCRWAATCTQPTPKGRKGELRAVATVIEQPGYRQVRHRRLRRAVSHPRDGRSLHGRRSKNRAASRRPTILINATHTHSAPSTVRIHGAQAEPEFVRNMEARIVEAVEQANAHLTDDCRFLFHLGQEPEHRREQPHAAARRHDLVGLHPPIRRPSRPARWIPSFRFGFSAVPTTNC